MITLFGIPYRVHSPSLLEQAGSPAAPGEAQRSGVTLAYDGRSWRIAVRGVYGTREFASRDEAAYLVATAFENAHKENLA